MRLVAALDQLAGVVETDIASAALVGRKGGGDVGDAQAHKPLRESIWRVAPDSNWRLIALAVRGASSASAPRR